MASHEKKDEGGTLKRGPGRPRDESLTERRREEILDAAARFFADRGYSGTDVQAIADSVGVGKGTVYRYFPTKRDLFLATVDQGMRRLHDVVTHSTPGGLDPLERIAGAVQAYLGFFDAHPELIELLIQERAVFRDRETPTYFQHVRENLRPWEELARHLIEEGRVRTVPVERAMDVVSDLLYGTIFTNYFARRRKSLEAQGQDVLDVVFRGLLSDRERSADVLSR